ncbi:hypothetical protein BXY70_0607 [Roseovarius halotolerans]|uniref:Uncharacterized protein n=1 Tax=Roseovarius halotolerans TaxID=505353 RepID=A0A1X6YHN4_9RHOB|nr:hypothetical protein [Roseovarius halotolerans]RKT34589.1 hypothetical protein BXY70_0607 [Roseovarius halotolerans]SLN21706.1 hypothetical protein ROH8110_00788 [Roseovarius halotolerans]
MVSLPDYEKETGQAQLAGDAAPGTASPLYRAVLMCLGAALLMAAIGLWMVPAGAGDEPMLIVKLLISAVMLAVGLMLLSGLNEPAPSPEIQIDRDRGELRLIERGADGTARLAASHELEALSEVSLFNGVLSARDARGCELLSLPVTDARTRAALRAALDIAN